MSNPVRNTEVPGFLLRGSFQIYASSERSGIIIVATECMKMACHSLHRWLISGQRILKKNQTKYLISLSNGWELK